MPCNIRPTRAGKGLVRCCNDMQLLQPLCKLLLLLLLRACLTAKHAVTHHRVPGGRRTNAAKAAHTAKQPQVQAMSTQGRAPTDGGRHDVTCLPHSVCAASMVPCTAALR